ncbi:MAG: glycosyltransferase family 2 protein [Lentisphaeraceae bacterium]|nr:glycosyltransferase family 2 protein [Lentisphaeraceae bacterium]
MFSDISEVSVVLTSCGRFDLLALTLESFFKFNTYPIKKFIITEDSGRAEVCDAIPVEYRDDVEVIVNKPALGQIKSIDLAYSQLDTKYIFHCEDDWEFYRPGFIEESKRVLEVRPDILQVWLRDYYHDIKIHSPYHYLGPRENILDINFYRVESEKKDWQGFSFNPGLRRLKDYREIGSYGSFESEKALSKHYAAAGLFAAILENSAVAHTGFEDHVVDVREKKKKEKKKKKYQLIGLALSIVSFSAGYVVASL